jgi:hypothetical protein
MSSEARELLRPPEKKALWARRRTVSDIVEVSVSTLEKTDTDVVSGSVRPKQADKLRKTYGASAIASRRSERG